MIRKNYFTFLLAIALFSASGIAVFAQTAPVGGQVKLKKADGTLESVASALVEVYRLDVKGKFPSDKTDKKGFFSFAGLPLGGNFVLAISAPNAKPGYFPNVKAGMDKIAITLEEGDGKRWTEEEVRSALSTPSTNTNATSTTEKPAELTAEQKKAQEEYQKKFAEVDSKNKKIENSNKVINDLLQEGNKAFQAKDYDTAVAKFDEGYKVDADFVGTAPVLLNNKAISLRMRGATLYNQSIPLTDAAARTQNMSKVAKDFADAIDAFSQSWTILKNAPAAEIPDPKNYEANKMQALRGMKDLAKVLVVTEKIDNTKTASIKTLIQEYIAVEPDKAAKTEAQVALADVFRIVGDPDNAIIEYRKALEMSPDNPDALAGLGLSLFDAGERANNTEQKQEGLNYMQKFAEVAPNTHKLKESVAGAVEYLKSQKLAPQKITTQKSTKKKN